MGLLRGFIDRWMSGKYCRRDVEVHGFPPLSSVGVEKATPYPVRNGGRTSKMISFCNSWEFESDIFGSLSRPLTGSHKSSMLVEQKSPERLRVLLLGFSTGFSMRREVIDAEFQQNSLPYLLKKILLLDSVIF